MKKGKMTCLMVAILCGSILFSSCIGSFKLFNNLKTWNQSIGSKFANELVFFCFWVLPVYEIAVLADVVLLNSIEFWSGSNPVASSDKIQKIKGENGEEYLVKRTRNGYKIMNEDRKVAVNLKFDEKTQTWSAVSKDKETKFMTFLEDNKVRIYLSEGKTMDVTLDQPGMMAFRKAMQQSYTSFATL